MADYEKAEKPKIILKGLKKLGLTIKHAKRHDLATCPNTQAKTTVPRHIPLDKYTVGSIYEFLIDNGYTDKQIRKAFKW